jgi:TRAP-type C4-dicarboxylate transport system permease large subunit
MGVLIIVSLAFGLITPPYGLILLLASTLAGVSFLKALRQSVPLYGVYFFVITLIILFPKVVLFLPRLILPQSVGCFANPSGPGYICPGL